MQHRSRSALPFFILCISGLISLWPTNAFAVDPEYLCTPTGSQCVAVTPTDWRFYPQLWAGDPVPGSPFSSFSEAVTRLEAAQNYCERTSTGVDFDYVPGPW